MRQIFIGEKVAAKRVFSVFFVVIEEKIYGQVKYYLLRVRRIGILVGIIAKRKGDVVLGENPCVIVYSYILFTAQYIENFNLILLVN